MTEIRNAEYTNIKYAKNEENNPKYIQDLFDKHPIYEFIALEGEKFNPFIYCRCKKCNKELKFNYSKFKYSQNHGCILGVKSSGEMAVEDYLQANNIKFKTQKNTLRCINPKTKHQMPYDFELTQYKTIIEVQGNQHMQFVEYFHGTIENYEYQIWKDSFKKEFAISKGYKYIELFYDDIKSGKFKEIIHEIITR